ncbi:TATA box-binding protein-associated factor RNA polymerase I subunit D-like [Pristis pectinata]|uniref:TATA box-binding protein-associated factor RNA polymerase I subunit D-like n=1 Tax=Pristis pectinata TaxID=685728 RepID=UPI00223E1845|nr:TATA box-binding protein-associated factor RNA polymerase I subunit D-like [Pristis pectinata]XP_051891568.1 TATA box-binding protein-associated factor RNA polymerase I subunit D-like [Pristis pectinata]XP_051891569.1 TATA box-binding protein-associated factor RNA polymerase I subunit D-like [Pristis pectinata]XP_051891570.1 TATA box-binding protein-associated factor RNA polymerase I subunit D-like [Pristis pectinata]
MEDSRSVDNEQVCTEDEDENSVLLFSDKENETKHLQQSAGMKLVTEQVDPAISSTEKDLSTNTRKPFDHVDQDISTSLSDSSDSVNSLFKTQCLSIPVRNKRGHLSQSDIRSQNGRNSESSSDSDGGLWRPSFLKIGEVRRRRRRKRSKSSYTHKKSGLPRGRLQASIPAAEKRRRLRERGLEFPFLRKEYGKKDLPFKMIFAYEQAALCGLFDYMKELKCQKHLITSLKDKNVDCTEREGGPTRQYKYLDEERPISPISESTDETCIEDLENEEAFDMKVVDNSCFIIEKRPEKKKKCFRTMHCNGKTKNRSLNSGKNKGKHEASGKRKGHVKNKQVTVEQKNHSTQNLLRSGPFKQKTSKITKEELADQTTADLGSLQNNCRPLGEQEDEGTETALSLKNCKSNKHSKRMIVQKREHTTLQEENNLERMDCELTMYQKVLCNGTARRNCEEQDDPVEQANKGTNLSSMLSQKTKHKLYNGNSYFTGSPL